MNREIEENLYRVKLADYSWSEITVKASSKLDLYKYILDTQEKNALVVSVNELRKDGSSCRVGFRGDKEFQFLKKERNKNN